jgi:hypothetical protein
MRADGCLFLGLEYKRFVPEITDFLESDWLRNKIFALTEIFDAL